MDVNEIAMAVALSGKPKPCDCGYELHAVNFTEEQIVRASNLELVRYFRLKCSSCGRTVVRDDLRWLIVSWAEDLIKRPKLSAGSSPAESPG